MGDHVVCEIGVLFAHDWCIVGECSHEFQRILASGLSEVLVLDYRDAELHKAVEQRLKHFWRDLGQIDKRDEGLCE